MIGTLFYWKTICLSPNIHLSQPCLTYHSIYVWQVSLFYLSSNDLSLGQVDKQYFEHWTGHVSSFQSLNQKFVVPTNTNYLYWLKL